LAIPVDRAPPPYRPPPRTPEKAPGISIHTGTLDDIRGPGVRRVQVQANLGRGCSLAALLGTLGLCAISGVFVWMLVEYASRDYDARALRITELMRTTAREQGRESTVDGDLRHFEELISRHEMSFIASAALVRRHAVAKEDGVIDADELDRMMEVVHDASIHEGVVDPARYPEVNELQ
jgi:hypothetical protein